MLQLSYNGGSHLESSYLPRNHGDSERMTISLLVSTWWHSFIDFIYYYFAHWQPNSRVPASAAAISYCRTCRIFRFAFRLFSSRWRKVGYCFIFFLGYSHIRQVIWFQEQFYELQTMQWRPAISPFTPLSFKENAPVQSLPLVVELSLAVSLPCLATPNSSPQPCKRKFGSSRRSFPLSPWDSFVSSWLYG